MFWSVCFDVQFLGFAMVTHTKGTAWTDETEGEKDLARPVESFPAFVRLTAVPDSHICFKEEEY